MALTKSVIHSYKNRISLDIKAVLHNYLHVLISARCYQSIMYYVIYIHDMQSLHNYALHHNKVLESPNIIRLDS